MIDTEETSRLKQLLIDEPEDYAQIIEDTDLAICITNQDAIFVAVNDNYCRLYGFKRHELVGKSFTLVVPAENQAALKKYHDDFFVNQFELLNRWVVQRRDGKKMSIFADAGYNEKILGRPHKLTFIKFQWVIEDEEDDEQASQGNKEVMKKYT